MKRLIVFMVLVQFIFASYTMAEEERFIPSDLVVKDRKAHKVWTRDANVIGNAMTWDDAFKAVKNLNEQKYSGLQCWRLPEKDELLALSEYISAKAKARSSLEPFTHVQPSLYWSITHSTYDDVWVTDIVFDSASVVSKKSLYYVWPVCDYDKKEIEADEAKKEAEIEMQKKAAAIRAEQDRQRDIADRQREREVWQKRQHLLKLCNNEVLTQGEFLVGKNVYADKGKCIDLTAATLRMFSINEGLFDIGGNQVAHIKFKAAFKGSAVKGLVKIKGMKAYVNFLGYSNEIPYFEMLEIKEIYGGN